MDTLIIFGEYTADEVHTVAERQKQPLWSRIEKRFFDADQVDDLKREITSNFPGAMYILGIADTELRRKTAAVADEMGLVPVTLIDPAAFVDPTAQIEPGCFLAAHCTVSSRARLARHTFIHFSATVGHNADIGEFSVILPGARLSGRVRLESQVMVGSNAFIFQGVQIGHNAKIDAMTYVHEDVPARRVVSVRRLMVDG